jgi:hypothetical protein
MKTQLLNLKTLAFAMALTLTIGCSSDDINDIPDVVEEAPTEENRWITIAGAVMGTTPGDGNGGTLIYSIDSEDAKNPDFLVDVFNNGFAAPSERTARLQSSEDGGTMFNIQYTGDNGGTFSKYTVNGGQNFEQTGSEISIAPYVGTAPRWIKLFDGDQTGAAVYVSTENIVDDNGTEDDATDDVFQYTQSTIGVVTLDLQNSRINNFQEHVVALNDELKAQGYYIGRIDMPTLNEAGDKLYIGTNIRKTDTSTLERDREADAIASVTIVLDYPTLFNPEIITSDVGLGDTNGYRSINAFLAEDGYVYHANQNDPNGSHILRIGADNTYDDSYEFSLDNALGIEGAYVTAWRYVGNGKAVISYYHDGSLESEASGRAQCYFALADFTTKTATLLDLPYDVDANTRQYQHYVVDGDEVYITHSPVGKDGNIYVVNTATGEVTEGAQLINATGSHFIGTW